MFITIFSPTSAGILFPRGGGRKIYTLVNIIIIFLFYFFHHHQKKSRSLKIAKRTKKSGQDVWYIDIMWALHLHYETKSRFLTQIVGNRALTRGGTKPHGTTSCLNLVQIAILNLEDTTHPQLPK